jgi:4-amino-4-deoxy-L-arabinose transferase-like glycosyltransferase
MADPNVANFRAESEDGGRHSYVYLVVLLFAASIYLGTLTSPPYLMDDVDSVLAQLARNMLTSGDWVTGRLDGIAYIEKAPLPFWLIAGSYRVFGQHDWAARLPTALSAIALAVLTAAFGIWAFGRRAGFYAGLSIATCIGLFLFTRVLIPDVMLTFVIALAMWSLLRVLEREEPHPRAWSIVLACCFGIGLLLKGLIAVAFPVAVGLIYLLLTRQLLSAPVWRRLHPLSGALIALVIAVPWHVLATLRNPPYFDFTLHSGPGQYHGFLWFYFFNEQVLRFLNLRYPRDYDTVPRLWFWLLHLVWFFPWSVYLPATAKLSFRSTNRAGRTRLLALIWIGFVMVFFTFSTTQEYYSMPIYPAIALLLGSAMAMGGDWVCRGRRALALIAACAVVAVVLIWIHVRGLPTPGDISAALVPHPGAYKLSLGHIEDLTLDSLAYLRLPLIVAGCAFFLGALGSLLLKGQRAVLAAALMMVLFFHAARLAMIVFDSFLSSHPLAVALEQSPPGTLIAEGFYYKFSSVFFYTNRTGLLMADKRTNLEYGSNAPGAPHVFIDSQQFKDLWLSPGRVYLLAADSDLPKYEALAGSSAFESVAASGGKALLTNHPLKSLP